MQFKKRPSLKPARIEIIPMIDTMFFLLVFFMLSSLALSKLNGLPVNLPQSQTAPRQKPAELTLTIDKNQNLFVNKTLVSFENLATVLVEKAGGEKADLGAATVIINADTSVPHGVVVRAIDSAREVGIVKFSIATAPENEAPENSISDSENEAPR